jgi:GTP-binding protein
VRDYNIVHNELHQYSEVLKQKTEIIALSKCDMILEEDARIKQAELEAHLGKKVLLISSHNGQGMTELLRNAKTAIELFRQG